jgi:MFS family permease
MTSARRALLTLSVTQIIAWGTLFYGITLLGARIEAETGWSSFTVYGGFSIAMLVSGLAAPLVGRTIDRFGGREIMAAGSVIGGLGYVILAFAQSPALYWFGWFVIGLGMAGSLYDPAFATLSRFAGARARQAISVLTLAGGLASTVFWPLGAWLLSKLGWRDVTLIYAGLNLVVCAGLHRFALPADIERVMPDPIMRATPASPETPALDRNLVIGCIAASIVAHGLITNAMSVHLISALGELGLSQATAVLAGALIGPSQSIARLIELAFGGRYPVILLGLISTALMPLAFLLLLTLPTTAATVIAFAFLYGASNGLLTIARGVIPLTLLGRENYGRTLGLISAPALAAKASAPLVFALLADRIGIALTLKLMGLCAIAALCAMVVLALAAKRAGVANR